MSSAANRGIFSLPVAKIGTMQALALQRRIGFYSTVPTESLAAGKDREGRFFTTRWSWVAAACDSDSPQARSALERLCQAYWPPLYAFALRRGNDIHLAQDLTQSFFLHFIARGYLRAADRGRGRFRTFLLTCFQHFLVHEWEKTRAAKRGGRFELLSWDHDRESLESRVASTSELSPEKLYDLEWALAILERALARLREVYRSAGQVNVYDVLRPFLHSQPDPGDYLRAARQLNLPERAVRLAVHRLRRRYGRLVREEVRETVADASDLEDEMRYLVELISS
jgi:DNA-directed RNA polymerase specialized sigma24 family protein